MRKEYLAEQYEPESKTVADNTGIHVGEQIITNCSPVITIEDFQTSFGGRFTSAQSDFDI